MSGPVLNISVLFFGPARVLAGTPELRLVLDGPATIADALRELFAKYPKLLALDSSMRVALDEEYASREAVLVDGQTMALIPPVQGG